MSRVEAASPYGEVYDRGYRRYDGPRLGRSAAIWALARWSMARALGLKKGWGAKVIPALLYLGSLLPVVVVIGVTAFFPAADIMDYPDYFATIFVLEGIFVATVAPEMLSPDRREGVLPLYFSRPIRRPDYVVAKLLGAGILTLSISLVPSAILWLGLQLLSGRPVEAMRDNADDLARIVLAGTLIAFYLGAVGLVISSFTGRKAVAVGIIVFGFLIAESLAAAFFFALNDRGGWTEWILFLSPTRTVERLVDALWAAPAGHGEAATLPLWTTVAVMAAVVVGCCAAMFARYANRD